MRILETNTWLLHAKCFSLPSESMSGTKCCPTTGMFAIGPVSRLCWHEQGHKHYLSRDSRLSLEVLELWCPGDQLWGQMTPELKLSLLKGVCCTLNVCQALLYWNVSKMMTATVGTVAFDGVIFFCKSFESKQFVVLQVMLQEECACSCGLVWNRRSYTRHHHQAQKYYNLGLNHFNKFKHVGILSYNHFYSFPSTT